MTKKSKVKEFYKKFKELWAIPRYRAIIKLTLYGIMFLIIILMANMYQNTNTTETKPNDENKTYTEIINSLDLENCDITYNINIPNNLYKIEGKIENNILTGYLENNGAIKKISVKDNNFYQIINNIEYIDDQLNNILNSSFMLPKNIINLVENSSAYINKGIEETTYTFNIFYKNVTYEVKIVTNLESLPKILISNNEVEYNLEYVFDKKA